MNLSRPAQVQPTPASEDLRPRQGAQSGRTDPATAPAGARALHARSPQGEVWFRLQRHQGGLYVEREEIPRQGLRCLQSMYFREPDDFERWCEDDPVRFEHPRLHIDLKRDAALLLQAGKPSVGDV